MIGTRARVGTLVVVLGLAGMVAGAAVAPQVWDAFSESEGNVAVVEVEGPITGESATNVVGDLRDARRNDSVRAVVLDVDSPGGTAAASEQLYLAVKRTSQTMPVVASVTGAAASGAYYTVAPADRIYVTPASTVGSIGVRAVLPSDGTPTNEIVTGPDKGTTATEAEVRQRIETLRRAFVGSVVTERENLSVTAEALSYAKLYSGARGVDIGLADRVAGIDTAIADAADAAGMDAYDVVRYRPPTENVLARLGASGFSVAGTDVTVEADNGLFVDDGVGTVRYLMLHGTIDTAADAEGVSLNVSA